MTQLQEYSLIIPVYNEEQILRESFYELMESLSSKPPSDVLLVENGSTDQTLALAHEIVRSYPFVRVVSLPFPNYGLALKTGLTQATFEKAIILNIDFWTADFVLAAVSLLDRYDYVIGSKTLRGSQDYRSLSRRIVTWSFNRLLQFVFGLHGTDTHGLKCFQRKKILPCLKDCVTEREVFDTELILRAERMGLKGMEIPVVVRERRPSRRHLLQRIFPTLRDLIQLRRAVRKTSQHEELYFYERIASRFDSLMNPFERDTRMRLIFLDFLVEGIKGRKLLDAGCGTGWFGKKAADLGADVIALDIGITLLKETRTKGVDHVVCGDLSFLPFREASFDVVIATEVLEHTVSPHRSLSELALVLKKEGILILTVPNRIWRWALPIARLFGLHPYEGYEHWVTPGQLKGWVTSSGLIVERMQGFFPFPPSGAAQKTKRIFQPALRILDYGMLYIAIRAKKR